ncbi:MAG: hypothetical protein ACAI44_37025 [Candidatus Sericytochromatia bacterium]
MTGAKPSLYLLAVEAGLPAAALPALGNWQTRGRWHWLSLHSLQVRAARLRLLADLPVPALQISLFSGEAWELTVYAAGIWGPVRHNWLDSTHAEAGPLLEILNKLGPLPPGLPERLLAPSQELRLSRGLLGDLPLLLQALQLPGIFDGWEGLQRDQAEQNRWQEHCELLEERGCSELILEQTCRLQPVPLAEPLNLALGDLAVLFRLAWCLEALSCPVLLLTPAALIPEPGLAWPDRLSRLSRLNPEATGLQLDIVPGFDGEQVLQTFDQALRLLAGWLAAQQLSELDFALHCAPIVRWHEGFASDAGEGQPMIFRGRYTAGRLCLEAAWPTLEPVTLERGLELMRWAVTGGSWQAPNRAAALRLYRSCRNSLLIDPALLRLNGCSLSLSNPDAGRTRHLMARYLLLESVLAELQPDAELNARLETARRGLRSLDRAWHRQPEAAVIHTGQCLYSGAAGDYLAGNPALLPAALRRALEQRSEALDARGYEALGDLVWSGDEDVLMRAFVCSKGQGYALLLADGELWLTLFTPTASGWLLSTQAPAALSPAVWIRHCPGLSDAELNRVHCELLATEPVLATTAGSLKAFLPELDRLLSAVDELDGLAADAQRPL